MSTTFRMARRLGGVVILACAATGAMEARAQSWTVPAELWDRPRSGAAVLALQPLRAAAAAWLERPAASLAVRHAPGQEAQLQAEEVRGWLVALAFEPARLSVRADLKPGEALRLEMVSEP